MSKLFIAQERAVENAGILIAMPMLDSASCNVKPILGEGSLDIDPFVVAFNNGRLWFVCDDEEFAKFEKKGIEITKKNPKIIRLLTNQFLVRMSKLNEFTLKVFNEDLSRKTNKELLEIYQTYYSLYWDAYPYAEPITWALRFGFVDELKKEIESRVKDKKKVEEYALVLTSPTKPSYVNEEEINLLLIIREIKESETARSFFLNDPETIKVKLPLLYPSINLKIEQHTKDYCWVPYDYGSTLWTKDYFLEIITDNIKKNLDVEGKIKKLQNRTKALIGKKKEILEELKLDKKTEELFEAIADSGYLLDLKKARFTISHYHMKKWFEETASRLRISQRQFNFMLPEDLENAIINNIVNRKELDERYNYCVVYMETGKPTVYYGEEARAYFKQFQTKIDEGKTELQGTCAHPGSIRGIARIVYSTKDISKMQPGEILVASMTAPDFVPAMRKAAAIVTDDGGITCHAAIVARELGIPCVVGTKIATKVFKDGDILELHGCSGVVRKIGGNLLKNV